MVSLARVKLLAWLMRDVIFAVGKEIDFKVERWRIEVKHGNRKQFFTFFDKNSIFYVRKIDSSLERNFFMNFLFLFLLPRVRGNEKLRKHKKLSLKNEKLFAFSLWDGLRACLLSGAFNLFHHLIMNEEFVKGVESLGWFYFNKFLILDF